VVIDEVHSLLRGDRGDQTLCCIERLSRMANVSPRRIGLSATIGDPQATGAYLSAGTGRGCIIPRLAGPKETWHISLEHFYNNGLQAPDRGIDGLGGKHFVAMDSQAASREAHAYTAPEHAAEELQAQVFAVEDVVAETKAAMSADDTGSEAAANSDPGGSYTNIGNSATDAAYQEPIDIPHEQNDAAPLAPPQQPEPEDPTDAAPVFADPGMAYIFEHTRGRKCLVFANSREEAEAVCTTLRQYCEFMGEPDRFLIHHGNLSSSLRESAEDLMRDEDLNLTTITTATLELGIDIGRLERAFQIDAPFTVSSFLQRMGRTGRRDLPPEMWFVIREEEPESRALLPETIPWKLLQACSLVQLYVEERWVEPPKLDGLPYSLLYHQTMATLAGAGELSPGELARRVLTLTPFARISTDDFRILLRHLLEIDHIEQTDEGGLVVGLTGERVTNNFKFYAVFQENEEFTVRSESQELGTIVMPPPVGERIAIAGATWVIEEIDYKRHLIECSKVKGRVPAYFGMVAGDVNTRILERMRQVLRENTVYPYLKENARARLSQARHVARNAHVDVQPLICLGGTSWCLFPWLGTYAFLALERFLKVKCADELGLKGLDSSRPYFMQFTMRANAETFFSVVKRHAEEPLDPMDLVYPDEVPYFDKYDEYVPAELIRKGFAYGVLDVEGMLARVRSWPGRPADLRLPGGGALPEGGNR
jgi:ATP-dependent Lhr-like helicase